MVMVIEDYERKERELEETRKLLRRKASEKVAKLTLGMPRWTIQGIADKVGLSKNSVAKIKAMSPEIGVDALRKILETDFNH